MDSRNPYNQSSSLVGLLNSQNFPYESYPSTGNFGASEIPPFSSQQTVSSTLCEDTPVVRMIMMFSRWLMTLSTLITTQSLILSMRGVRWGMNKNGLTLTLLNLLAVQREKLVRQVSKFQTPLLAIMRSGLKVSRLLKLKGIMLKGSLLLSIRAFGKWRKRISWWRRNSQSWPY